MQDKHLFNKIRKIVSFLPTSLCKLIYVNIVGSLDIQTFQAFSLLDLERTININNEMTSCKIVFQYNTDKKDNKITFTLRFKNGTMKSLHWSI